MRGSSLDPGHFSTVEARPGLSFAVRRARTADVAAIRHLVDTYSASRILLSKETVTLYEDVQEFWVADDPAGGGVIGCGALHVMWEDLAEVRTLATDPRWTGRGVGSALLSQLLSWPTIWA
jgi:amino-acid N-acetyltransferase